MKRYNHAYTIAFTIENDNPDGNFTTTEVVAALNRRIADLLENDQFDEAIGAPFDTFENEDAA